MTCCTRLPKKNTLQALEESSLLYILFWCIENSPKALKYLLRLKWIKIKTIYLEHILHFDDGRWVKMLNISNKRGTKKCQIHHLMNATTTTTTTTTTMMMMIEMILKHKTTPFHLWHINTKVRRLQNLIHSTFSLLTNQSKQRHEITFEVKLKVKTCCFTYEIQSTLNFISTLFFLTFSNGYTSPAAFSFLMISALFFKVLESLRRQHGMIQVSSVMSPLL